jgi:cell fate (sporulation/competence/biofilm development) regulator YlbF (YheA/YmcA/DUF963 family)
MEAVWERAKELGRVLGQSDEYKAVNRAKERLSNDREIVTQLNRLGELETEIARSLQRGEEPPAEMAEEYAEEYEKVFTDVQARPEYQQLVAAQSNFDKILARVNEEIGKGMTAAAQSRIILPS